MAPTNFYITTEASKLVLHSISVRIDCRINRMRDVNVVSNDDTSSSSSTTMTSEALGRLAAYHGRKQRGSIQYYKVWKQWIEAALTLCRQELVSVMSLNDDQRFDGSCSSTTALSLQLGVAADVGAMPLGFQNEAARVGYAVGYLGRVRLLANLLFHQDCQPDFFRATWERLLMCRSKLGENNEGDLNPTYTDVIKNEQPSKIIRLTSLGGGPGFDFCALSFIASLRASASSVSGSLTDCEDDCQTAAYPTASVHATILDYAEGWGDLVDAMAKATCAALAFDTTSNHSCRFGGKCDITQPIFGHASNVACLELLDATDIWVCQYCVTENAIKLREFDFVFFRELFAHVQQDALFVFSDTTHRLWPELVDIAAPLGFEVAFLHGQGRWKAGYQMVMQAKRRACTMSTETLELYQMFVRDRELHQRKLEKGYTRPTRRVPEQK